LAKFPVPRAHNYFTAYQVAYSQAGLKQILSLSKPPKTSPSPFSWLLWRKKQLRGGYIYISTYKTDYIPCPLKAVHLWTVGLNGKAP